MLNVFTSTTVTQTAYITNMITLHISK